MLSEYLKGCVGVVEANSYETMCLWNQHQQDWDEGTSGPAVCVGKCAGKPVMITLLIHEIYGQPVLFFEPVSTVIDHDLIRKWLNENLPQTAFENENRIRSTDAMNFHIVWHHAKELSEKAA